jgi:hypothetical protein
MRFRDRENKLMWEAFIKPYDNRLPETVDPANDEFGLEEYPDNKWDETEDEGEEGALMLEIEPEGDIEAENEGDEVLLSDLKKLSEYSQKLLDVCKTCKLDTWMVAKIIKASDYVSDVWHRLDAKADFANDGFEQSDNMSL